MRSTSDLVRTAIRVEIARQDITRSRVAKTIGKSDAWLSTRLGGQAGITTDDLDLIASGLGVSVSDLLLAALAESPAANGPA